MRRFALQSSRTHVRRKRANHHRGLRFAIERLEERALLAASISISDATAIEGSDTLKFIDRFVSEGSGGLSTPRDSTFGPDGNNDAAMDFYVTSANSHAILRYDGETGAFLDEFVDTGSGGLNSPVGVEFGSDGDLYVTGSVGNHLLRYNASSGAFLNTVASGLAAPNGITIGRDGNVFIANGLSDNVMKYDGSSVSVFVTPGSGGLDGPRKAAFGPDGNHDGVNDLYVTSQGTGGVLRYDGVTGSFIDVFATTSLGPGPMWLEFGADGFVYTTFRTSPGSTDTSIVRFDSNSGVFVDRFDLGRDGWTFSFGPDDLIYNSSNGAGNFVERFGHSSLAVFTVSLSEPSASPVTVAYSTSNGSASAGGDYIAASGTLTFAPGQTTRTILVQTLGDAQSESAETFTVNLSNAVGATIADGQGVGTIQDNDPIEPTLSINDITVAEEGPHAAFTVRLNVALASPVTVDYATTDKSAQAGLDYVATAGSVTFAPGQTTQTILVPLVNDAILEDPDETFSLQLSNAQGAAIGDAEAIALVEGHDFNWTMRASSDGKWLEVYAGNPPFPGFPPAARWPMTSKEPLRYADFGGSDDAIFVELPAGSDGPDGGILFGARDGLNELHVKSGRVRIDSTVDGGTLKTTVAEGAELITTRLEQNDVTIDGRLTLLNGGTTSTVTSLTLGGNGMLDLADNALVVDYSGASPLAAIRERILSGRGGSGFGAGWKGPGINSSTALETNKADPESRSLGYAENAALPLGPYTKFRGAPVDETSVLIAYTRTGDANLDGLVNDDDVTIVGATYAPGVPQPQWALGDFDYNGFVDDDDVTLLGVFYDPGAAPLAAIAPAGRPGLSDVDSRPAFQGRPETSTDLDGRRTESHLSLIDAVAIQQLLAQQDDAFSPMRRPSGKLVF
ncbi:MAG: Calx-beta domain-containing protein [Pirellulales bacterium]